MLSKGKTPQNNGDLKMKKFRITAVFFDNVEETTTITAMDESEAMDKWGEANHFKYEYVTKVEEVK